MCEIRCASCSSLWSLKCTSSHLKLTPKSDYICIWHTHTHTHTHTDTHIHIQTHRDQQT